MSTPASTGWTLGKVINGLILLVCVVGIILNFFGVPIESRITIPVLVVLIGLHVLTHFIA